MNILDIFEGYVSLLENFTNAEKEFEKETGDLSLVKNYIERFKSLRSRNRLEGQEKDINFWRKSSWEDFKEFVEDKEKIKSSKQIRAEKKKDALVVLHTDDMQVIVPFSEEASNLYGASTKWCTTSNVAENTFNDYIANYNVILFYVLTNDGKKYAAAINPNVKTMAEIFDEKNIYMIAEDFADITGLELEDLFKLYEDNKAAIEKGYDDYLATIGRSRRRGGIGAVSPEVMRANEYRIAPEAGYSFTYATRILKDRFKAGEPAIMNSPIRNRYIKFLQDNGFDAEEVISQYPLNESTEDFKRFTLYFHNGKMLRYNVTVRLINGELTYAVNGELSGDIGDLSEAYTNAKLLFGFNTTSLIKGLFDANIKGCNYNHECVASSFNNGANGYTLDEGWKVSSRLS